MPYVIIIIFTSGEKIHNTNEMVAMILPAIQAARQPYLLENALTTGPEKAIKPTKIISIFNRFKYKSSKDYQTYISISQSSRRAGYIGKTGRPTI